MGNWDFDGDEVFFFVFAGIIAVFGIFRWYRPLVRVSRLVRPGSQRPLLAIAPLLSLVPLALVLTQWADPKYVIGHFDFQLLFLTGGAAWIWLATLIAPEMGISPRDDAIERHNTAAAVSIFGAMLGVSILYAGANIGAGPTIWTTIAPAIIGTIAWFILWLTVELISRPSEAIAIDRDLATAIRQFALFVCIGLILGRASAGDWTSWDATFTQLERVGSPAALVAFISIVLHAFYRPSPAQPQPSPLAAGLFPAAILVAVTLLYIVALGMPDIGKHIVTFEQYMNAQ